MKNLTEKEQKLLEHWMFHGSSFNFCKIDLKKTWKEQELENEFCWEEYITLSRINKILGTTDEGSRGVIGSLQKKGLIKVVKGETDSSVLIREEEFNNIKKIYQQDKDEKIEFLIQELKDYITMLVEHNRFKMATYYSQIATKIFYRGIVESSFLQSYGSPIDDKIKNYFVKNNLLK